MLAGFCCRIIDKSSRRLRFQICPVAQTKLRKQPRAGRVAQLRAERHCPVIGGERLVISFRRNKDVAAADPCLSEVGLERQRPVVGSQGLAVPLDLAKHLTAADPGKGEIGLERQRPVVSRQCRIIPLERAKYIASVDVRFGVARLKNERPVKTRKRRIIFLHLCEDGTSLVNCGNMIWRKQQKLVELGHRFFQLFQSE